jgi:hypothetical protein
VSSAVQRIANYPLHALTTQHVIASYRQGDVGLAAYLMAEFDDGIYNEALSDWKHSHVYSDVFNRWHAEVRAAVGEQALTEIRNYPLTDDM